MKTMSWASWVAIWVVVCAGPVVCRGEVLTGAAAPGANISNGNSANVPAFASSAVAPEVPGSTAEADGKAAIAPGMSQVQVHACDSSSPAILGADADGSGQTSFADSINITSSTLPAGTMVPIEFTVALRFRGEVIAEPTVGLDDGAGISANFSFSYTGGEAIFGSYVNGKSFQNTMGNPTSTGIFTDDKFDTTFDMPVGSTIEYNYGFSAGATCAINGLGSPYVDGDITEAMAYGYGSSNPDVTLTTGSGTPVPGLDDATMDNANANLIPDPFYVPEPGCGGLLVVASA